MGPDEAQGIGTRGVRARVRRREAGILSNLLMLSVLATSGCSPQRSEIPQEEIDGVVSYYEQYGVIATLTDDENFAAVAASSNGERIVAMTEFDEDGGILVTGGIWTMSDGAVLTVYRRPDGLPDYAILGNTIYLFDNYTEFSADVAIVHADGTYGTVTGVPIDPELTSFLTEAITPISTSPTTVQAAGLTMGFSGFSGNDALGEVLAATAFTVPAAACMMVVGGEMEMAFDEDGKVRVSCFGEISKAIRDSQPPWSTGQSDTWGGRSSYQQIFGQTLCPEDPDGCAAGIIGDASSRAGQGAALYDTQHIPMGKAREELIALAVASGQGTAEPPPASSSGSSSIATGKWTLNPQNGHYYALTQPSSWAGTAQEARAIGGHLVVVNDADENAWLVSTFGSAEMYWIGFTDLGAEGHWAWVEGWSDYSNWHVHRCDSDQIAAAEDPSLWSNEPNNYPPGEDAAALNFTHEWFLCPDGTPDRGPGEWNDLPTDYVLRGIAEWG